MSVISGNNLRGRKINAASNNPGVNTVSINDSVNNIKILFLDRWVGIEGLIAVSNKEDKSWDLLKEAISEKYDENKMSFYDSNFISSAYKNTNMNVNHYVTLPGFIAFFYYSGQIWFLCIVLIILGLLPNIKNLDLLSHSALYKSTLVFGSVDNTPTRLAITIQVSNILIPFL